MDWVLEQLRRELTGRYELEREIGRGGMAVVYLARDVRHERRVALKVLHPELGGAPGVDRFLREIRTAASLLHPHILQVHDSGAVGDLLFYVMPYVEGENLRQRLDREGPLPAEEAARLGREVADALAYAHERGVVHRDIKPENILLASGHALVADFGIARAADAAGIRRVTLTDAGSAVGTPAYMSPEQAAADPRVNGRADQYALGCVVYEMLTGAPPFTGPTPQAVMARHARDPVPPLSTVRAVPAPLETAVTRALAKAPADRWPSARAFGEALEIASTGAALPHVGVPNVPTEVAHAVRARRSRYVLGGMVIGVLALGAFAAWQRAQPDAASASGAAATPAPAVAGQSIAVLPFENTSGDAENEHFSDGLTDELIGTLSTIQGLEVAARTSSFALKGRGLDARTIADTLGVETLLEGSVRRDKTRLKVAVQLVNPKANTVLWHATFDRELRDVFAVQAEIAQAIVAALKVRLSNDERTRLVDRPTHDLEAYELYLRGRQTWNLRGPERLERAVAYLRGATERDPQFAMAYVGLADLYVNLANYGQLPTPQALSLAERAVNRALELDSTLAEAHASRGFILTSRRAFAEAERAFREAIALNPNYPTGHHFYSLLLMGLGRLDEALEHNRAARRLDPLSLPANANLGIILCQARDYSGARRELQRTLTLAPNFPLTLYYLGVVHAAERSYDEATAVLERAAGEAPAFPGVKAALAYSYSRLGRQREADGIVEDLRRTGTDARGRLNLALAHAMLGETDSAFTLLGQAQWDLPEMIELRADPLLAPLRADRRYDALLRALGLER